MEDGTTGTGTQRAAGDLVTPARWLVRVDEDACLGSGGCTAMASRHFRLDGGVAVPAAETVEADRDVLAAAHACPAEAITVIDAATGELLMT